MGIGESMQPRLTQHLFFAFCGVFLLGSCGGGSGSSGDTTLTDEQIVEEASNGVLGILSVIGSANVDADVSALHSNLKTAVTALDGANCSYSLTGISGMDLTQTGPGGTFGPTTGFIFSTESITLSANDYCGNGGEWTGFSFNKVYSVALSCDDGLPDDLYYDGQGVLRVNSGSVELYGRFLYEPFRNAGIVEMNCHYIFNDSGPDEGNCKLVGGSVFSLNEDLSCDLTGVTDEPIDTTDPQISLYLFPTGETGPANFGGRDGADFACRMEQAANYDDLHCVHGVRAFVSVSDSDEILDMPDNYGVETSLPVVNAVNDQSIADDWANLLDGTIDNALTVDWWSGSSAMGANGGFNCSNWTNVSGDFALTGTSGQVDSFWIQGSETTCADEARIMCLCF